MLARPHAKGRSDVSNAAHFLYESRTMTTAKSVAAKARVKPGTTVAVLNRVPGIVESLGLPGDVAFVAPIEAELVLLFVNSRIDTEPRER